MMTVSALGAMGNPSNRMAEDRTTINLPMVGDTIMRIAREPPTVDAMTTTTTTEPLMVVVTLTTMTTTTIDVADIVSLSTRSRATAAAEPMANLSGAMNSQAGMVGTLARMSIALVATLNKSPRAMVVPKYPVGRIVTSMARQVLAEVEDEVATTMRCPVLLVVGPADDSNRRPMVQAVTAGKRAMNTAPLAAMVDKVVMNTVLLALVVVEDLAVTTMRCLAALTRMRTTMDEAKVTVADDDVEAMRAMNKKVAMEGDHLEDMAIELW